MTEAAGVKILLMQFKNTQLAQCFNLRLEKMSSEIRFDPKFPFRDAS